MEVCSSCGASVSNDLKFCKECGTKLAFPQNQKAAESVSQKIAIEKPVVEQAPKEPKPPKQPMSMAMKILLGLIVLLVAAVGVGHFVLQKQFDPWEKLAEADKAFIKEDYAGFASYFHFAEGMHVDEEAFWKYMDEQEWDDEVFSQIEEALEKFEEGKTSAIVIKDVEGNRLSTITQEKFLGIYDDYVIEVEGVEVSAATTVPKATLAYGDGKTIEITDEEYTKIGLFAPGTYNFDVTLTDDFGSKTIPVEQFVYNQGRKKAEIDFAFYDEMVTFTSDYDDAIVFIDGKSTGKKASELVTYTLETDGSVEVYAEHKNGEKTVTSEKIKLEAGETHIPFADVQEKKKKEAEKSTAYEMHSDNIRYFYENFRADYSYAVNYADFNNVVTYFEPGSTLFKDYKAFVDGHESFGYYYYEFISNEITDLYAIDGNTVALKSNEIFYYSSDDDGDWHYDRDKLYTIKINDGDYTIVNIEDIGKVKKTRM